MFENIDELIEINLRLLYTSKAQYMMRINFKDEYGYNLKNSKAFADVLVNRGIVQLESNQGFRCDLTDLGRVIYEKGGWNKYLDTVEPFSRFQTINEVQTRVERIEQSFMKKIMVACIVILVLCFFITLFTVELVLKK